MLLFAWLCAEKMSFTLQALIGCAVSFTVISVLNLFKIGNISINIILAILISCVGAVIAAKIYKSKWLAAFLLEHFTITPHDNIWVNIIDFQTASVVKVYPKGEDYCALGHFDGSYMEHEQSLICLDNVRYYDINENGNEVKSEFRKYKKSVRAVFNLASIDRIEVFKEDEQKEGAII